MWCPNLWRRDAQRWWCEAKFKAGDSSQLKKYCLQKNTRSLWSQISTSSLKPVNCMIVWKPHSVNNSLACGQCGRCEKTFLHNPFVREQGEKGRITPNYPFPRIPQTQNLSKIRPKKVFFWVKKLLWRGNLGLLIPFTEGFHIPHFWHLSFACMRICMKI